MATNTSLMLLAGLLIWVNGGPSNNSHYLHFHLINERGRSIKVTLWGSLGEELLRRCGGPDALYVIVLPAMKVREYRGKKLYLHQIAIKTFATFCCWDGNNTVLIKWYRLCLQVSDESRTLVVTLFDDVAEALIQKKSTVIIQEMAGRTEENEYPTEILLLVVFEFKTHTYYNLGQYESFTVARVIIGIQALPVEAPANGDGNTKVDLNAKTSVDTSVTDTSDVINLHFEIVSKDRPEPEKDVCSMVATPAKTSMKWKFNIVSDDED